MRPCSGTRYRKQILSVRYRGCNIAEVLEMTIRVAFSFFRGQRKVQAKLKQLIDVGLEYLPLGNPPARCRPAIPTAETGGLMSAATRNRTLFLLDEPTTGLHFADVVKLLDCFGTLLAVGHSLIVVEHNLQLMRAADWIIDLGPAAAAAAAEIVVQGPPETVAQCEHSATGQYLPPDLSLSDGQRGIPDGAYGPACAVVASLDGDFLFATSRVKVGGDGFAAGKSASQIHPKELFLGNLKSGNAKNAI